MEQSEIEKIERMKPEEIWDELGSNEAKESSDFLSAVNKVTDQPNLYYVEADKDNTLAMVRRRGDDLIVYETHNPDNVVRLKIYGIEK